MHGTIIYIYIYVCSCVYTHIYIYMSTNICEHTGYMYIYIYICMHDWGLLLELGRTSGPEIDSAVGAGREKPRLVRMPCAGQDAEALDHRLLP